MSKAVQELEKLQRALERAVDAAVAMGQYDVAEGLLELLDLLTKRITGKKRAKRRK